MNWSPRTTRLPIDARVYRFARHRHGRAGALLEVLRARIRRRQFRRGPQE